MVSCLGLLLVTQLPFFGSIPVYYFRYPAFTIKHFINIPEEESEASNHAKFLVKAGLWSLVHRPNSCLIGSIHPT